VRNADANDVNDTGAVVGSVVVRSGERRAYRWEAGHLELLPGLGGRGAALAVNAGGDAVGYVEDASEQRRPVMWHGLTPALLPLPADFPIGVAIDINDRGDIVGNAGKNFGGGEIFTPWVWRADGSSGPVRTDDYRDARMASIDNRGRMTGRLAASPDEIFKATAWRSDDARPRVMKRFKESNSQFQGASDAGDAVGIANLSTGPRLGFITELPHFDRMVFLEPLDAPAPDDMPAAVPHDVNRARLVVGATTIDDVRPRATVWDCSDE
jgi:uncharacterized membrane protein